MLEKRLAIEMQSEIKESCILKTRSRVSECILRRRKSNVREEQVEATCQVQEVLEELGNRSGSVRKVEKHLNNNSVIYMEDHILARKIWSLAEKYM